MPEPAPVLLDLCRATLGSITGTRFVGWDHGESLIWEVSSAARERSFMKAHRQEVKFRQELHAYRRYGLALSGSVPKLLAQREQEPWALLLSALPGVPLETLQLDTTAELDAHRQAGQLLARLHDQPVSDTSLLTPDEAFAVRLEQWSARADGLIDDESVQWVSKQVHEALPLLRGLQRVPCHRDYTPRNWLWRNGKLSLIDFEHSRPDLWFLDLERLWAGLWLERPDLREAFLAGYGRKPSETEERLLERLGALGALTTIVWAHEHDDADFEAQGRSKLMRLKNECQNVKQSKRIGK